MRTAGVALLWGEQERPTRGPRPSLGPGRIAETAVVFAEAEGLDAVSMSKIAAELGVSGSRRWRSSALALYRYVPGRTGMIELMTEAVLAEGPGLTAAGDGRRPRLEEWARRYWAVYHAHPLAPRGHRDAPQNSSPATPPVFRR
ncbi:TetR/AcrR family transcriptional regulator [Streptomyces mashuensis]|uniref:TetR/AcrR family transcriptional regulator n=1 Tax=Streptomyces mashuensis TaxID=33904 RepID=UPI00167D482C|nr:hypothetical protein [Streptomyces mashuensis]